MLIELSELYDIDIREIIDGERKSEIMNEKMKDTLDKVAQYTEYEKEQIIVVVAILSLKPTYPNETAWQLFQHFFQK